MTDEEKSYEVSYLINSGVITKGKKRLGAIYLDGGLEPARRLIERHWAPRMANLNGPLRDAKSALQEWMQAHGRGLPQYRVVAAEGPDHRKQFAIEVLVGGEVAGQSTGRSKKEAEQVAARDALAVLKAGE